MYHIFSKNRPINDLFVLGPNGVKIFHDQLKEFIRLVQEQTGRSASMDATSYTLKTFADLAEISPHHVEALQAEIPMLVGKLKALSMKIIGKTTLAEIVPSITFTPGRSISLEDDAKREEGIAHQEDKQSI